MFGLGHSGRYARGNGLCRRHRGALTWTEQQRPALGGGHPLVCLSFPWAPDISLAFAGGSAVTPRGRDPPPGSDHKPRTSEELQVLAPKHRSPKLVSGGVIPFAGR